MFRTTRALAALLALAGLLSASTANGQFLLVNKDSRLVLDADTLDNVERNGCRVQLWDRHGLDNQRWDVVPTGDGFFKLRCRASNKVLSAHLPDVNRNGCRVVLWDDVNAANQQWRRVAVGGGFFKVVNRMSGLLLSAHLPNVHRNGCEIVLWDDALIFGNQHWRFQINP